ncbi:MAG: DUF2007 domain-containing protein [Tannerella sp.]|nr:DUF2007 domain-containing protein [Tannerella sp.]
MEQRIVEIANFRQTDKAEMLASVLRAEGVDCYVRNGISSNVFGDGAVDIGAKVELLDTDLPRALEIMQAYDYALPDEILLADYEGDRTPLSGRVPFLRRFSLETQIVIVIALVLGLLALLVYLGSILTSSNGTA